MWILRNRKDVERCAVSWFEHQGGDRRGEPLRYQREENVTPLGRPQNDQWASLPWLGSPLLTGSGVFKDLLS